MKKFLIFIVLLIVGITYVNSHYTVADAVDYAVKKNDPKLTPKIEYWAGYYLVMKERYEESMPVLQGVIDTWPDSEYVPEATFHLGEAYESTRQKDKAKELYEHYLEIAPKGQNSDLARRKLDLFKSN